MCMILFILSVDEIRKHQRQKHQEEESAALLEELQDSDLPKEFTDKEFLILGYHHMIDGIDGIDYQIMSS